MGGIEAISFLADGMAIALPKILLEWGDRPVCLYFEGDRIVRDLV